MKRVFIILALLSAYTIALCGCSHSEENGREAGKPLAIFPDYMDVTIPANIAPLNFRIEGHSSEAQARFVTGGNSAIVKSDDSRIMISARKWRNIISQAVDNGGIIEVVVSVKDDDGWVTYTPFKINIAAEPIDSHIAYRLIEPGYESWCEMGIYQRNIESFEQKPIIENSAADYGCVNCHSFCGQNPDKMLFHMRQMHTGTIITDGKKIEKLNTTTPETRSPLVYPSWHPSGRYVAFSVNDTKQMFHTTSTNRIEVMDFASDVVVYDVENHQILTTSLLSSKEAFETFPTFSPDGKTLYYCVADSVQMPLGYERARYNLCSIPFNPENRSFGTAIDTLLCASDENATISFPRVSPDGRFLMFTQADYGNFTIWHKEADLHLLDLETKQTKPLDALNSDETESYHMWSSNGRWVVFSSRRLDGLYTRPFIAYMDEDGNAHKPFLLPQKSRDYYTSLMKSYNVPEFITGEVEVSNYQLSQVAKQSAGIDVSAVAR